MKVFFVVSFVFLLSAHNLFGDVRNGYQRDIENLRSYLNRLQYRLVHDESLTGGERRQMRKDVKAIRTYLVYFELTKTLLERFRKVSPAIYKQVNELRDEQGNAINIYVKFLPDNTPGLISTGSCSFIPYVNDSVGCSSEFGTNSAVIRIRITNDALEVLAHEFGHLIYIVGNLPSYIEYYRRVYGGTTASVDMGHRGNDPSGTQANLSARQYRQDRAAHVRNITRKEPLPLALLADLRSKLQHQTHEERNSALASQEALNVFMPGAPARLYMLP